MKSIVLLSGGLDSVVSFKMACDRTQVTLALTFDYGQRSAQQEVAAAGSCCRLLGVPHQVIELGWLAEITGTALVDRRKQVPELSPADLGSHPDRAKWTAQQVWVPNRNGVFANIAACFAESLGAELIITGFNAEEAATFPDNSPQFVEAVSRLLQLSTLNRVRVISYTQDLNKAQVVRLGMKIGAPLQYLYSCYLGQEPMCGWCESCQRLKRAFRSTGNWRVVRDRFVDRRG